MMTLNEISALLGLIAGIDRKMFQPEVTKTDLLTWHATIGDLEFTEARAAVWEHYANSTEWLMPAHIKRIAKQQREVARRSENFTRQLEARSNDEANPMPQEVRELLEERWGPREGWASREKLGSRPLVRKPGEPDVPKHRQPSALGDVLKELPIKPSEALQEARRGQGVLGIPTPA